MRFAILVFIFQVILAVSTEPVFADGYVFNAPKNWDKQKPIQKQESWAWSKNLDARINIQHEVKSKPYELSLNQASSLVQDIAEGRKMVLSVFGITNYQVKKHTSRKIENGIVVRVYGQYINNKKIVYMFIEEQVFRGKEFVQVSLSYPATLDQAIQPEVETIMQGLNLK